MIDQTRPGRLPPRRSRPPPRWRSTPRGPRTAISRRAPTTARHSARPTAAPRGRSSGCADRRPRLGVHDLGLDPANSNVLYVAVRGFPEATGGIWRTNNAKAPTRSSSGWTRSSPRRHRGPAGAPDHARRRQRTHASVQRTLYAAVAARDSLWGFYKTTNGGASWAHSTPARTASQRSRDHRHQKERSALHGLDGDPRIVLDNRYRGASSRWRTATR